MKAKTKRSTRSVLFIGLVFLAIVSVFCAVFSMNAGKNGAVVDAAENVLIDFSASDITAAGATLVTDVDTNGDGVVEAKNAMKCVPSDSKDAWQWHVAKFNGSIDLTDVEVLTIRLYIRYGTIDPGSLPVVWLKTQSAKGEAEFKWWSDFEQNKWIDLVLDSKAIADMTKHSKQITGLVLGTTAGGTACYDDRVIYVDKISIYEEEKDANVPIEFSAADTTVRRGSQVVNIDTDNDGVVDCANAWKITASSAWDWQGIDFNTPLDLNTVDVLSARIYVHYSTSGTPLIQWQAIQSEGGDVQFKFDGDFEQDKWIWVVFTDNELKAALKAKDGKMCGLMMGTNGNGCTMKPDAYILFDKLMVSAKPAEDSSEVKLLECSTETTPRGGSGSIVTNVDANNDGYVDCLNAWKVTPPTSLGWALADFSEIDMTNVTAARIRIYVHWAEVTDPNNGPSLLIKSNSSQGESSFFYTNKIVQDKWYEIKLNSDALADMTKLSKKITGLVLEMSPGSAMNRYSNPFILIDGIYVKNYDVTFNYGSESEVVKAVEETKVTAPAAAEKAGYTVEWYTDAELTNKFDFNTAITADTVLYAKYKVGSVYGASVSLEGDVAMNFYVTLSDTTLADASAKIRFTFDGNTKEVAVTEGVVKEGYRVYTYNVAAKDYDKNVTMTVVSSEGEGVSATCSVEEYAAKIAAGDYEANVKTLAARLVNYCEAAKVYFADTEVEAKYTEVTAETVKENKLEVAGVADEGVTVLGASLVLESKTAIRVYFTGENAASAVVKVNGEVVTAKTLEQNEKTYYVEVENIAANDLDKKYVIEIGSYKVTYRALSYVYANLANEDTAVSLANVLRAMYLYNRAADAYVGA